MLPVFIVVLSILVLVYLGHARAARPTSLPPKVAGLGLRSSDAQLFILILLLAATLVAILMAL